MNTAVDVEWEIVLVSALGTVFTILAIIGIMLRQRASAQYNGELLHITKTDFVREMSILAIQIIMLTVGVLSLFEGQHELPVDGLYYRRSVLATSVILSMGTAWALIRSSSWIAAYTHQKEKAQRAAVVVSEETVPESTNTLETDQT